METSMYARNWDRFVDTWEGWKDKQGREDWIWPGDEWGDEEQWDHVYRTLFVGAASWKRAVEIGQGSGKYTERVLNGNDSVSLRAYDVSPKFLEVCGERCKRHVDSGRLSLREINTSTPRFLLDDLSDWKREVDALYSIGVMVHIDLQWLIPYLLAAGATLRESGKLIVTLGTANTEAGFHRLLQDVRPYWQGQVEPTAAIGKYEWLGGCVAESVLRRLGFEVDLIDEHDGSINMAVVATLVDPERADRLVQTYLS